MRLRATLGQGPRRVAVGPQFGAPAPEAPICRKGVDESPACHESVEAVGRSFGEPRQPPKLDDVTPDALRKSASETRPRRTTLGMVDPYFVSDVRLIDASPKQIRTGLLGFLSCTVGGQVRLDGMSLRRSQSGRLYVAFPARRDARGREHPHVRPLNASAHRDIEAQLFRALGIRLESAP